MNIILDTNIIVKNFALDSPQFKALFDYTKKTNSNIILLDIVSQETVHNYKKDLENIYTSYKRDVGRLNKLTDKSIAPEIIDVAEQANNYKIYLEEILEKNSYQGEWRVIPSDGRKFRKILSKAIEKKKPFSNSGNGFKDAVIWETIISYCKHKINYDTNIFVTENKKDFANDKNTDFHPYLDEEVKSNKLQLEYCNSLTTFLSNNAEKIEHVTIDWINERINYLSLATQLTNEFKENKSLLNDPEDLFQESVVYESYNVFSVRHVKLKDFTVYAFSKNNYLLTLYFDVRIKLKHRNKYTTIVRTIVKDIIYDGGEMTKFSPN